MITATGMRNTLRALELRRQVTVEPEMWREWANVIANVVPEATDEDLKAATDRLATFTGFLHVGHLVQALQGDTDAERATRADRIDKALQTRPLDTPDGLEDDPLAAVAWRRAAIKALGDGSDRETAEKHAWHAIGMSPPMLTPPNPAPQPC
ncbi:hypothetical protein G7Y41_08865 [Schaalia sp. ZJ405]|uniref:hypothetical protein n=1 Tax=Schaalia sp. ZJ405 TaxID=2709403 RepID=UPI0013EDF467|nr:hypothetical protein [Schaalia sp. ZJ405]QPK81136.1 hypothetical protein G7Y41_08865 [Schaalia sp. ZJ405]